MISSRDGRLCCFVLVWGSPHTTVQSAGQLPVRVHIRCANRFAYATSKAAVVGASSPIFSPLTSALPLRLRRRARGQSGVWRVLGFCVWFGRKGETGVNQDGRSAATSVLHFCPKVFVNDAAPTSAGLTKSVALDFVSHQIRCNCVCPGTVDVRLFEPARCSSLCVAELECHGLASRCDTA